MGKVKECRKEAQGFLRQCVLCLVQLSSGHTLTKILKNVIKPFEEQVWMLGK